MKYTLFMIALFPHLIHLQTQHISKNKMDVQWQYKNDRIHFTLKAPTQGWLTIGFNPNSGIKDSYLIMARIENQKVEVKEHYTLSPGNYKSLMLLGEKDLVENQKGEETSKYTEIQFSLPINAKSKYRYNLEAGKSYNLILAYSKEDDFQHHSIMRTSTPVKL